MKLNQLYVATLIATLPATSLFAAALERSNQSISAFLESGNYIEAGFDVVDQNISSKIANNLVGNLNNSGYNSSRNLDVGTPVNNTTIVPNIALKIQATEKLSAGLIYDQPFGIHTHYTDASRYFGVNNNSTEVKIDTKNITLLFGYKPVENIQLFIGPVYQEFKGFLDLEGSHATRVSTTSRYYEAHMPKDEAFGWLTGLAYSNIDYGIKSSLTYRSAIKHEFKSNEPIVDFGNSTTNIPMTDIRNTAIQKNSIFKTPQSVNLSISKELNPKTTTSANIRWVDWSNFELFLPYYSARANATAPSVSSSPAPSIGKSGGYNPIAYEKDQWSINLGLDHKLNENWKVSGSLGWDSGVGEYISHYTPINGSWSAGVGVQFSPASNYFVQTGIKYIWLDDVKGQHAKQVSENSNLYDTEFNDNHALSYDFKIGYRF
ncbi:outer membrane protein transport protein [Acinetobacter faecalis]|uniref:OmpP1/FadL family transporter n=1 Tax=Acinetobacter faecalis TaxID=2665161 RepID=UPI002A911739|nr:outer membrane protein transport protein [Acinetobacter faecalis]MDY6480994.1 outer membrane protein transport protein [Acinetobacter faecalis]